MLENQLFEGDILVFVGRGGSGLEYDVEVF